MRTRWTVVLLLLVGCAATPEPTEPTEPEPSRPEAAVETPRLEQPADPLAALQSTFDGAADRIRFVVVVSPT